MRPRQRLVVCLDGTWNNKDDSTNVLHHFSLVKEGPVEPRGGVEFVQKRLYEKGVGTGVLDSVTGGGFGFGLEEHVREAYNWLVQEYHGDDGHYDEIYIFGFSRGAFTARSLVGYIGCCGLLRRGAPLTVRQLWSAYILNGRRNEERASIWTPLFGEPEPSVRPLGNLVVDPWLAPPAADDGGQAAEPLLRPGITWEGLNEAERLLVYWSRRVPVTYLGIYDTVGAMGFDALAIPGLSSRLTLHHNMRPTSVMQKCRHALAIDEHRSGFRHTPLRAYLHNTSESEWTGRRDEWNRRIEQRWFVGAHSNIGGGYESNVLANAPLEWMLEGAEEAGLVCERRPRVPHRGSIPLPRDSYAEFAAPFWATLLRGKRHYRPIDPGLHFIAARGAAPGEAGLSLAPINEVVDATSLDYWARPEVTPPPNLIAYARRRLGGPGESPVLRRLAAAAPEHPWLGERILPNALVVFWATFAATGIIIVVQLLWMGDVPRDVVTVSVAAAGFVLVDWVESRMVFQLALGVSSARARAFCAGFFWLRAFAVGLFFLGAVGSVCHLAAAGLGLRHVREIGANFGAQLARWWPVPAAAVAAALLANAVNGGRGFARRAAGALVGAGAAVAAAGFVVLAAWACARVAAHVFALSRGTHPVADSESDVPADTGLLFVFLLAFFWVAGGLPWVSEPLAKANLGTIERLRRCATPAAVARLFREWRTKVSRPWLDPDAQAIRELRDRASEALWRDIFWYIPAYLGPFLLLIFLALAGNSTPIDKAMKWFVIGAPLAAAVANLAADALHLSFVRYHTAAGPEAGRTGAPSLLATLAAYLLTWVKKLSFAAVCFIFLVGVFTLGGEALESPEGKGWRGALALSLALFLALSLAAVVFGAVKFRVRRFLGLRGAGSRGPVVAVPQADSNAPWL
jgi:uncharacterized protein (DUF2235 family)